MTVPLLDRPPDIPLRGRLSRWRWVAVLVIVVALVGAFLYFGPIGLGNGPLSVTVRGAAATADPNAGPVGTVLPIVNSDQAPAVVDGIDVVGGTRYPSPRLLASAMLATGAACSVAVIPAHPAVTGPGFTLKGCGGYRGLLVGHTFRSARGPSAMIAAAELTAPPRGTCWVMTKVVVHYHVGGKHFSGAYPFQLAACLGVSSPGVLSALRAADGNTP